MLVPVPLAKPLRQPHPAITLCATQWRTGVRHRRRRSLSPGRSAPAPVMRAQPRGHSLKTNTFSAARPRSPHDRQRRCPRSAFPLVPRPAVRVGNACPALHDTHRVRDPSLLERNARIRPSHPGKVRPCSECNLDVIHCVRSQRRTHQELAMRRASTASFDTASGSRHQVRQCLSTLSATSTN